MNNISGIALSANSVVIQGKEASSQAAGTPVEIKNGSTLSGRVVSITDAEGGKIANIDIGNATISAKLSDGMGLREGQILSFAVRGTSSSTVSITPLLENTSIDQSTLRALQAAGLEITDQSVRMVKEMMEAGLPIDKSSLHEMNKNVNTYSDTGISTLVEMKSLGIPISENNIEQYTSYKNFEHQVVNEMTDIADGLPEAFKSLMDSGNTSKAMDLYGSVLKLFGEEISEDSTVRKAEVSQNAESALVSELQGNEEETAESKINADGKIIENIGDKAQNAELKAAETGDNMSASQAKGQSMKLSGDFINSLHNLNNSEKMLEMLKGNREIDSSLQKNLFKELANAFENADLSNPVESASWKKVFSSDDFGKLLKENIKEQWLLRPDDVEKKENVNNLYQRLGAQAKALAETITNTLGAESKLAQSANNLNNNLDFMNQLNQMFQYIQLPLQMQGQNANGDLYVYKNKNKKLSEDGSVSAVLHLDMDNLGPVDVYVKMLDSKVTTNFYVADDSVIDLINDNIHILNERLSKRGYDMKVNISLHDTEDSENQAVDELLRVSRTPVISTTSFDARA